MLHGEFPRPPEIIPPAVRAGQPGLFSGLEPQRKRGNSGPFPGHCSLVLFSRFCSVTDFSPKVHTLGGRVKFGFRPADAGLSSDILATPALGRYSPGCLYSQLYELSVCISCVPVDPVREAVALPRTVNRVGFARTSQIANCTFPALTPQHVLLGQIGFLEAYGLSSANSIFYSLIL